MVGGNFNNLCHITDSTAFESDSNGKVRYTREKTIGTEEVAFFLYLVGIGVAYLAHRFLDKKGTEA